MSTCNYCGTREAEMAITSYKWKQKIGRFEISWIDEIRHYCDNDCLLKDVKEDMG